MSLSNQNEGLKNPSKKFLEFKGGAGKFSYYDKEKGENVDVPTPFYLVVLDQLHTIKGWHDESESSIYSNEVHDTNREELNVKAFKGGEIVKGLYQNIKGNLQGGKYHKSVYAVMLDKKGNPTEMVNLSLKGAALSAWIDAEIRTDGGVVTVGINPEQKKKGATKYYEPSFKSSPKREDVYNKCIGYDQELQEYLSQYKSAQPIKETVVESAPAPEPQYAAATPQNSKGIGADLEDDSELPF